MTAPYIGTGSKEMPGQSRGLVSVAQRRTSGCRPTCSHMSRAFLSQAEAIPVITSKKRAHAPTAAPLLIGPF